MIEGREAFHEEMDALERDAEAMMRRGTHGCLLVFVAFAVLGFAVVYAGLRA